MAGYWKALTVIFLLAITLLSLWPLEELPTVPGTDKTHHVIAYGFLMLPTALRRPKNWHLIGLLFIVYSGLIECLQPYVNRYGEWLDMAANTAGIIAGIVVAECLLRLFPLGKSS